MLQNSAMDDSCHRSTIKNISLTENPIRIYIYIYAFSYMQCLRQLVAEINRAIILKTYTVV